MTNFIPATPAAITRVARVFPTTLKQRVPFGTPVLNRDYEGIMGILFWIFLK